MRRLFLMLLIMLSIGVVNAFPLGYDNYKLIDAIPKGNIVDDRVYEDKVIRIEFDDFTGKYPQFTLRNISNTPLTILWDLCAFVDSTGRSQGVIRSNIPFLDRGKPVPPTLVIPRAFISEVMVPLDSIDYDGGWIVNNSIPKEAEQTLTIVLTVEQGGKQTTYMFTFESVMASRGVLVEGGTFTMGDTDGASDEKPTHKVTFTYNFYIGKYEVTFDEYDAFCSATGKSKPNDQGWGRGSRPVINVTWWDAIDYCNWLSEKEKLPKAYDSNGNLLDKDGRVTTDITKVLGYRLPTEAEWEFAARGGNKSRGYQYAGSSTVGDVAWYDSNSGGKTQEVGKKAPNELGIYDMSGNVWEWCSDWYGNYSSSAQTNPYNSTAGSYRVYRGGSWRNFATSTRVAFRGGDSPTAANYRLGFRIARTVP
jgi:formylglycine-generating enzyme required for sulfatase activity